MADEVRKVLASIAPATDPAAKAAESYEELWRELVSTKAKLADVINEIRGAEREREDLRRYCARSVKRLDAIAAKLARAYQVRPQGPRG